jgi:isopenicillin N synthase-like dioxygenase
MLRCRLAYARAQCRRRFTTLPVIDVSPLVQAGSSLAARRAVGAALHAACRDVGFFNVVAHGVPPAVTDAALADARAWFERTPEREKRTLSLSAATGFRGYAALGQNVTQHQPDLHEGLDFYAEQPGVGGPLCAPNPWPRGPLGHALETSSRAWVAEALRLGAALMRGIALGLDLPERFFDDPDVAGAPPRARACMPSRPARSRATRVLQATPSGCCASFTTRPCRRCRPARTRGSCRAASTQITAC